MPFVLDASAALAWCFSDEATPASQRLLATLSTDHAFAPALWPAEIANTLLMAARRGRLSDTDADEHLLDLMLLPIKVDGPPDAVVIGLAATLARAHRLTIYDAIYLELVLRLKLPIATLDDELRAAARAEGATLLL